MNNGSLLLACCVIWLCFCEFSKVAFAAKSQSQGQTAPSSFANVPDKGPFEFHCREWTNHTYCKEYETIDVMRASKYLDSPPIAVCKEEETVQGLTVCKDNLRVAPAKCHFLTIAVTETCDQLGALTFEKHWSQHCVVSVIHFVDILGPKGGCSGDKWRGKQQVNLGYGPPGLTVFRFQSWHRRCYSCFFLEINKFLRDKVDVLKIQELEPVSTVKSGIEDTSDGSAASKDTAFVPQLYDGIQYTILSSVWNYRKYMLFTGGTLGSGDKTTARMAKREQLPEQVIFRTTFTKETLIDQPDTSSAHASNMIAAKELLSDYGVFYSRTMDVPEELWPVQLEHFTVRVGIEYKQTRVVSFMKLTDFSAIQQNRVQWAEWQPVSVETLAALSPPPRYLNDLLRPISLPDYCSLPSSADVPAEMKTMRDWVDNTLNARCAKHVLSNACVFTRKYEAFIPCPSQLIPELSLEYALAKGWCDLSSDKAAVIEPLVTIPATVIDKWNAPQVGRQVSYHFERKKVKTEKKTLKRLAFFLLIHNDPLQVERLLTRLYSRHHYYMLHIDPGNKDAAFVSRISNFVSQMPNVYISRDIPIIYPASSATVCLVRAMAWFLRYVTHWDYFVTLTGSDYPLIPLSRMEYILSYQDPPMPFLMAWDPEVNMYQRNMRHANSVYRQPEMAAGIDANIADRGDPMGKEFMQMRTFNYGTPTTCNGNSRDYYRLDPRRNVTGQTPNRFASQFLFPLDEVRPRNPFAVTYHRKEETQKYKLPPDGGWRKWAKSDPMFTGAYDRESVRYIVESREGKLYFQYFSRFLMGSEEHYFSSLFYNWPRTNDFVTSLAAQIQWNTWKYGLYLKTSDGMKMHTHFLSPKELEFLRGMSKRGVFFARKFSTEHTQDLQNMIDEQMLGIDCSSDDSSDGSDASDGSGKSHDAYCTRPSMNVVNITATSPYNITLDAGRYWPGFLHDIYDLRQKWKQFKPNITRNKLETGEEAFPTRARYYDSH